MDDNDRMDVEEEARLESEQANAVALKVQRQQEGLESALLDEVHRDEQYRTVDDVQMLLEEQRELMGGGIQSTIRAGINALAGDSASDEIGDWYTQRSKYIPLRLKFEERKRLRLIQSAMKTNNYTNLVDTGNVTSVNKRKVRQAKCIQAVLLGIATTYKYHLASGLLEDPQYSAYESTFARAFEIGRRYKVTNPEKMREYYGKLIYLLQDSRLPHVAEGLEFDLVMEMSTVYSVLEKHDALDVLKSNLLSTATVEILPDGKTRGQIQREIKAKENAIEQISRKFAKEKLTKEEIRQCLYSIGDNSSYLNSNCKPIDFTIDLLKDYFGQAGETQWSLAIYGGESGSRLTHSHERQYFYVLQSLTLWREIVHDMFRLWYLAEEDLLDPESPYKLKNTGQGINRLQAAPRTSKAMHGILYEVQQRLANTAQGWVGSSVIHLGDTNVPNALVFIDKYNQVPRILNPIVQCLKYIRNILVKDQALVEMVDEKFGGVKNAEKTILHDFFRKAFDGSGADNFFEAGSCIDGRLTSAWNWCQDLPSKDYYILFKLSGFLSFDGEFQG